MLTLPVNAGTFLETHRGSAAVVASVIDYTSHGDQDLAVSRGPSRRNRSIRACSSSAVMYGYATPFSQRVKAPKRAWTISRPSGVRSGSAGWPLRDQGGGPFYRRPIGPGGTAPRAREPFSGVRMVR